eukprot:TRINITY_DN21271_c0_g3_i1.p1 TRINITY_DN21271_c0_g3~~TRINITY_DN21271_c0_g3_i1.p1  ORF type:complete len:467 (-),score=42.74 TRINITY_DN21271_c0_g3_i1:197-1552(-)
MVLLALIISILLLETHGSSFTLPSAFEGLWSGIPEVSIMGPWSNNFTFSISKADNGDYVFQNMIPYDGGADRAWQRFYVEASGETSGNLWYCNGFSTSFAGAGARTKGSKTDLFQAQKHSQTDRQVTFCMASETGRIVWPVSSLGCTGCDCGNWTLTLNGEGNVLESSLSMAGARGHTHAKHLSVKMSRVGLPAAVRFPMPGHGKDFVCDFEGRDGHPIDYRPKGCPYADLSWRNEQKLTSSLSYLSNFQHCYMVNRHTDYILEWTTDSSKSHVFIQVSASAMFGENSYIAIGFRPLSQAQSLPSELAAHTGLENLFGMTGADIVAGSKSGVKTMYAELYTGPPVDDASLQVEDASVTFVNGRIILSFVRPIVSGKLGHLNISMFTPGNDILYAVGESSSDGIAYHGNLRGLRPSIDWEKPDVSMHSLPADNPWLFSVESRCSAKAVSIFM